MRLDLANVRNTLCHAQALVCTNVVVGVLTTAEPDADLDLVAVLKELARELDLDRKVVVVCLWTDLELLELRGLATRLGLGALALVLDLSVVSDSTDWRVRIGRNFNQVQTSVTRQLASIIRQELTQTLALFVDKDDAGYTNSVVDTDVICFWTGKVTGATTSQWGLLGRVSGSL